MLVLQGQRQEVTLPQATCDPTWKVLAGHPGPVKKELNQYCRNISHGTLGGLEACLRLRRSLQEAWAAECARSGSFGFKVGVGD